MYGVSLDKPDDLIELGRVGEPYGLKGLVNILPSSDQPDVLLKVRQWWLSRIVPSADGTARKVGKPSPSDLTYEPFRILSAKPHADRLVAHLEGIEDRDLAAQLKGCRVYVSRGRFPALPEGEFYWVDLQGCAVHNLQGVDLGVVAQVIDHGAHPILVVQKPDAPEVLIPFVAAYVSDVRVQDRLIQVDWLEDYA